MNAPFSIVSILILTITFLSLYLAKKVKSLKLESFAHVAFVLLAVSLMAHLAPGFDNILIFNRILFASDSLPFTMYLNFDKPFLALIIFSILGFGAGPFKFKRILLVSFQTWLLCCLVLIGLAMYVSYIKVDIKMPAESYLWTLNNLLLVCTAEEAFFRRYLQGGLSKLMANLRFGAHGASIISALLFGLAHYKGGVIYMLLSSLAGLFYGFAYMKTQRTETAILAHFGLNATHFFFFSYPALVS